MERIECKHCRTVIVPVLRQEETILVDKSVEEMPDEFFPSGVDAVRFLFFQCPSCKNFIIYNYKVRLTENYSLKYGPKIDERQLSNLELIYPLYRIGIDIKYVPDEYNNELNKALAVLSISADASALLSRRLLQRIIRERYNIRKKNLLKEIAELIKVQNLPSYLERSLYHIRDFGNLAAHAKANTVDQLISVTRKEAEYLIETIEQLLDFAFVKPAKTDEMEKKLRGDVASEESNK